MSDAHTRSPPSEVAVDAGLVRRLLAAQHPDLSDLSIEPFDAGWDNALFRLGTQWAVRLPRRSAAVPLLEREQRWLSSFTGKLPIAIPTVARIGQAGEGYPWNWSIVPWLPGTPADVAPPNEDQAEPLAAFLRCLHIAAPPDAPKSQVRGVPLTQRAAVVEQRLNRLAIRTSVVTQAVWRAWRQAIEAPEERNLTWIHGDLHARNVLVEHGNICAIVDWGDIASGDKATDLAAMWMLCRTPRAAPGPWPPTLANLRAYGPERAGGRLRSVPYYSKPGLKIRGMQAWVSSRFAELPPKTAIS